MNFCFFIFQTGDDAEEETVVAPKKLKKRETVSKEGKKRLKSSTEINHLIRRYKRSQQMQKVKPTVEDSNS